MCGFNYYLGIFAHLSCYMTVKCERDPLDTQLAAAIMPRFCHSAWRKIACDVNMHIIYCIQDKDKIRRRRKPLARLLLLDQIFTNDTGVEVDDNVVKKEQCHTAEKRLNML